jgi:hypothetical protein
MKVETQKEHFLTDYQKKLKGRFMSDLMNVFGFNIQYCVEEIEDQQAVTDLLLSVIIMFSRESLVHFFSNSSAAESREMLSPIVDSMFSDLKKQIIDRVMAEKKERKPTH